MGRRGVDSGYQSLLARRGHQSLSPPRLSFYPQASTKYNYLAHTTNETQQILKEIITTERKIMQRWPQLGYSDMRHSLGQTTYGSFHTNFTATNSSWGQTSSPYQNAVKLGKSYVRNRSYDPVLGHLREYGTPTGIFQALGTNRADFYATNGLYRAPSIAHFRSTLRR